MRSNAQWYEPCDFEGGGKGVGSFTVPLKMAAVCVSATGADTRRVSGGYARPPGTYAVSAAPLAAARSQLADVLDGLPRTSHAAHRTTHPPRRD